MFNVHHHHHPQQQQQQVFVGVSRDDTDRPKLTGWFTRLHVHVQLHYV